MTTQIKSILVTTSIVAILVVGFQFWLGAVSSENKTTPNVSFDLINMTEEMFWDQKEQRIIRMISDTARQYGLNPFTLCGLSYYESNRFHEAHKKRKDSNNRFSYGLFQIQLETALLYDSAATGEKLLWPPYNTSLAAQIMKKNLSKYKSYDYAIAAHNAGSIKENVITNAGFVKSVYAATGEISTKYPYLWDSRDRK